MGCCPRAGIFETESTVKKCDGNRKGRIMEEKRKNTISQMRLWSVFKMRMSILSIATTEQMGYSIFSFFVYTKSIDQELVSAIQF